MSLPPNPTFAQFWPYYLGEHSKHATRAIHTIGTIAYLSLLLTALVARRWEPILACPVIAYGLAWFSHFAIEKNRPATFRYPWLSLLGDHLLAYYVITGRIDEELARHGIRERPTAS